MRRPTVAAVAALFTLVLVVSGCGGDDDGSDTSSTTTSAEATETESTTAPEAEDAEVDCEAYDTVVELFGSTEEIATGSNDVQVAADESLAEAVDALRPSAEGDQLATEALDTLGEVSFQVTDEDSGPSGDEVDSALVTIQDAWSATCAAPSEDGGTTTVPAEGEEEGTAECPAPEVLEAEGFTCDSEGHLTPVEGTETDEGTEPEDPTECPAPEVLEAEGYTCDSEGNLTPVE